MNNGTKGSDAVFEATIGFILLSSNHEKGLAFEEPILTNLVMTYVSLKPMETPQLEKT